MSKSELRALAVHPSGQHEVVDLNRKGSQLEAMYEIIGCRMVEYRVLGAGITAWWDEEFLVRNDAEPEPNFPGSIMACTLAEVPEFPMIHGTMIFILMEDDGEGDFFSMPDETLEKMKEIADLSLQHTAQPWRDSIHEAKRREN